MTQYEVTHGCHPDPTIAYVKRSPHVCQPFMKHKCASVQDEIALISLHEDEMAEIVRRSNDFDDLVAALDGLLATIEDGYGITACADECSHLGCLTLSSARATLQKARGAS